MLAYIHRGDIPRGEAGGDGGFLARALRLGGASPLRLAAGNVPPQGRYLCLVPVHDAWRVDPALAGKGHFAAALEPAVLDDLRGGRALLVFDLCNEGIAYHGNIFDALHGFADAQGIAAERMVWVDQNRALERVYRRVRGVSGAAAMRFAQYDFFVKHAAWSFSPDCPAPVLGGDPQAHAAAMFDVGGKDRLLLCLNATPRRHRVVVLAGLLHLGLFERSAVSFAGMEQAKDGDGGSEAGVLDYLAGIQGLAHLAGACGRVMGMRGLRVDGFAQTGNALFDRIDLAPYRRSFFSLVTETECSGGEIERVTEKAVKAFAIGHPCLVAGNPGALRFLRELGVRDFAPGFDGGYDAEGDPGRRIARVLGQAFAQDLAIAADPAGWLGRMREAGVANIRHAAGGGLLAAYVARHEQPLVERLGRWLAEPAGLAG